MTYSLLLTSPNRHMLAVATATCTPAVGRSVPAARPGVGGVVSQAHTNSSLRTLVLDRLAAGATPAEALADALATDDDAHLRQVAVLAADGRSAAHVGHGTTAYTGMRTRDGAVAIGNYLADGKVLDALIQSAETGLLPSPVTGRDLAGVALSAMQAAQAAGGDRRGQQSAALTVIEHPGDTAGPEGRVVISLAVDDDPAPLETLERLLRG